MSQAAIILGADPIQNATLQGDESDPWEVTVLSNIYETVKNAKLGDHFWRFATKTIQLTKDASAPTNVNYAAQYLLPSDRVGYYANVIDATSGAQVSYEVAGSYILTNNTTGVLMEYVYELDESLFPSYFQDYLILSLASKACFSITEDATKKRQIDDDLAISFYRAKLADAQGTPPDSFIDSSTSTYIAARYA